MKLLGGWLPFVGFRDGVFPLILAEEAGMAPGPAVGKMLLDGPDGLEVDCMAVEEFAAEWLGYGIQFAIREKRA